MPRRSHAAFRCAAPSLWMKPNAGFRLCEDGQCPGDGIAPLAKVLDTMKESTQAKLDTSDIPALVKLTGSNFGLTDAEGKGVLQHLLEDADYTLYGLANAVTRFSQDVDDYDRASKLEVIGYNVMTMSPAMFRQINQASAMAA